MKGAQRTAFDTTPAYPAIQTSDSAPEREGRKQRRNQPHSVQKTEAVLKPLEASRAAEQRERKQEDAIDQDEPTPTLAILALCGFGAMNVVGFSERGVATGYRRQESVIAGAARPAENREPDSA